MKLPSIASRHDVRDLVRRALTEDIGTGDVTSRSLVGTARRARAAILTREPCVVAGGPIAALCFRRVDRRIRVRQVVPDGCPAAAGRTLLLVEGPARGILTAERTALNFMQRLCGIATLTRRYVDIAAPHGVAILDTRKTIPLHRAAEKYAVLCGGGQNHRMGLYDRVLIKDNHRQFWAAGAGLGAAVRAARLACPGLEIEIEVESEAELRDALQGAPDWILLDNMSISRMRRCVALIRGRCRVEASGGITLARLRNVARTGVDAVSVGALTHSARAIDLSLEIH